MRRSDRVARRSQVASSGAWSGRRSLDRRGLFRLAGAAVLAAPAGGLLVACSGSESSSGPRPVRIGYVSPRTGPLRRYADVDNYVISSMSEILANGIKVGNTTHPVQIFVRDSQSDRNRAAAVTSDLIFVDEVDIVLASATTDTVNPVSDQCEANGVPCLTTEAPWQSWFFGRGGSADAPFTWTYHFSWDMTDLVRTYVEMWRQLGITSGRIGALLPFDADGDTFANPQYGLATLANSGFQLVPERYQPGEANFAGHIQNFQQQDVKVITGVPSPSDFQAFWRAMNDRDYLPQAITMSKALYFVSDVESLGATGDGLSTEVTWSTRHPYRSSLTQQSAEELANQYAAEGQGWVQALGYSHALFEVVVQALANVDSIDNARGIAEALAAVNAQTVVGQVAFGAAAELPKNVGRIPLVGGQWIQRESSFDLRIVANNGLQVPTDGTLLDLPSVQSQ